MIIGILQVELHIGDALSLKDKRRVLRSLKDRIGASHNLAIAEVDRQDAHQAAVLGIVAVSNSSRQCQAMIDQALQTIRNDTGVYISNHQTEFISGN